MAASATLTVELTRQRLSVLEWNRAHSSSKSRLPRWGAALLPWRATRQAPPARLGLAALAAQASGNTWYPNSFLAPLAANEPYLSSALAAVDAAVAEVVAVGIPAERTVLLGFSQGACLMLEYAARHARRYGGLVG